MDIIDEYNMLKKSLSCICLSSDDIMSINKKCSRFNIYLNIIIFSMMILVNFIVSSWSIMMSNILISKIFAFTLGNFGVLYLTLFFRDIIKNYYKNFVEHKVMKNKLDDIENRLSELSKEIERVYNIKVSNDKDFLIIRIKLLTSEELKEKSTRIIGRRTLDNNYKYKSDKPLVRVRKK